VLIRLHRYHNDTSFTLNVFGLWHTTSQGSRVASLLCTCTNKTARQRYKDKCTVAVVATGSLVLRYELAREAVDANSLCTFLIVVSKVVVWWEDLERSLATCCYSYEAVVGFPFDWLNPTIWIRCRFQYGRSLSLIDCSLSCATIPAIKRSNGNRL
jgi:hypothetical protein